MCALGAVLGLAGVSAMAQTAPPRDAAISFVDEFGQPVTGLNVGAVLDDGTYVSGTQLPDGSYLLNGLSEKVQLEIGGTAYGKMLTGLHVSDKFSTVRVLLSRSGATVTLPSSLRDPSVGGRQPAHALEAGIESRLAILPRDSNPVMLGTSNCCVPSGGLGCDDAECTALICGADSFCCDVQWDTLCANAALASCRICAAGPDRCAGDGEECTTALSAVTGNNAGSTAGNGGADAESSCLVNDFISEWWCWTADCDGTATASTCNQAAYDTTLSVFDGCGGAEIICTDDSPGCGGFSTSVSWAVTDGTEYKIRVSGYNGASGAYTLTLSCEGGGGGDSNCCVPNGGLGCDDPDCQAIVCGADAFCCDVQWDQLCANAALAGCAVCQGGGGDSNCCVASGGLGCDDAACTAIVCAADAFCCDVQWDQLCANAAIAMCGDLCAGGGGGPCGPPNTGDCCLVNATPGCSDAACCELICALDPFCCDTSWDGLCQGAAFANCAALCGGNADPCDGTEDPENEPDCGGVGGGGGGSSCCVASGGLGCDDPVCQAAVCAVDAFCCDTAWDGLCAGQAATLCPVLCAGGGAPVDSVNGGCNSTPPVFTTIACGQAYCGTVAQAAGFRDTDWYAFTVGGVDTNITFTVTANFNFVIGFVNTNNCATANALDPFATGFPGQTASVTRCFSAGTWWAFVSTNGGPDLPCDGEAFYGASLTCGGPCDTSGACCFSDGSCTDGGDAFVCAGAGGTFQGEGTLCDLTVCPVACGPLSGDCCTPNGGIGCNDPACCNVVCAADPFCCDVQWDTLCANAAGDLCPNCVGVTPCGPPNTQDCFVSNPAPGCSDAECCEAVCAADSFCCDVSWDGLCAGAAATICFSGGTPENDDCEDAEPINIGDTVSASTIGSTIDSDAPACVGNAGITAGGIWYVVIGDGTTLTASTCNQASYDTQLTVYCGDCPTAGSTSNCCVANGGIGCDDPECTALICGADAFCCDVAWDGLCAGAALTQCEVCLSGSSLTCVVGLDDTAGCANFSTLVSWCSQPGVPYLILVHGFGGAVGNFNLTVSSSGAGCVPSVLCTPVIPTGACCICLADCTAACETLQEAECQGAGGTYLGDGTSCETSATINYAANVGTAVPDNNPNGITHVINVPDSFSITDVNVGVNVSTTWFGDLCVEVEHGGTTVLLIQRPGANVVGNSCHAGTPFGCANDNINVTLDDEAGAPIETQCALNLSGSYTPFEPLGAFDGADASGNWTITVIDNGAGDLATLNSWSLSFPDPNPVGPCDGFLCDSGDPVVECVAELIADDRDDHGDDDDDHSSGGGNNDDDDHSNGGGDDDDHGGWGGGGNDDDDDHSGGWGDDDDGWGFGLNGGGGNDDDDDHNSGGNDGNGGPNLVVSWTASDDCGLASVTGVIDIGCDVIPIESGQLIELKCAAVDGNGFWWWWCGDDDDDDSSDGGNEAPCSALFVDGVLVIESASATLVVTATDLVGNTATCEVDLCALVATDDDDHGDDHDDDDDHSASGPVKESSFDKGRADSILGQ